MDIVKQVHIYQRLLDIFVAAKEETFTDGMESVFSIRLDRLIKQHGKAVIDEIERFTVYRKPSSKETVDIDWEVGEAFRCLGKTDDAETHDCRLMLLEKSLTCSSAYLRDSAELGLESMKQEVKA